MNQSLNTSNRRTGRPVLLARVLDRVTTLSFYTSGVALFLLLFLYVYEVVMRYFLNTPTSWSNDVIQLFFAAMIMLAVPEITRINRHIIIAFFSEKMNPGSRMKLSKVIGIIGCVLCFIAAYICLQESIRQYQLNIETMWNNPIPKWWISGFIPYGFILSGLQMLKNTLFGEDN